MQKNKQTSHVKAISLQMYFLSSKIFQYLQINFDVTNLFQQAFGSSNYKSHNFLLQ